MEDLITRCRSCRKKPANCHCYEYRLEIENNRGIVYIDNLAMEPVRGEDTGTWQLRKNGRVWRRPTYVDAFGPICILDKVDMIAEAEQTISEGTFNVDNYKEVAGCRVTEYERDISRKLPFLRRRRTRAY